MRKAIGIQTITPPLCPCLGKTQFDSLKQLQINLQLGEHLLFSGHCQSLDSWRKRGVLVTLRNGNDDLVPMGDKPFIKTAKGKFTKLWASFRNEYPNIPLYQLDEMAIKVIQ